MKTLDELVVIARSQPGGEEILKKWAEDTLAHHNNPLYHRAAEWTNKTRAAAINKGAGKYPKPLSADIYTFEELFEHAMAENVDQQHYLTALRMKFEALERLFEAAEGALMSIRDLSGGSPILSELVRIHNISSAYFSLKDIYGGKGK